MTVNIAIKMRVIYGSPLPTFYLFSCTHSLTLSLWEIYPSIWADQYKTVDLSGWVVL